MSFHAPQAYTKETLAKAFDWLQHQPPQVTQAASTPDNLVAIYLKAQRQGITTFDVDAPNSSRKFIDDLKTLQKEMAPFGDNPPEQEYAPREPQREPQREKPKEMHRDSYREAPVRDFQEPAPNNTHRNIFRNNDGNSPVNVAVAVNVENNNNGIHLNMDPRSLEYITQIQQRFNLGSPQEAIRMLISVGYKQITQWP